MHVLSEGDCCTVLSLIPTEMSAFLQKWKELHVDMFGNMSQDFLGAFKQTERLGRL